MFYRFDWLIVILERVRLRPSISLSRFAKHAPTNQKTNEELINLQKNFKTYAPIGAWKFNFPLFKEIKTYRQINGKTGGLMGKLSKRNP